MRCGILAWQYPRIFVKIHYTEAWTHRRGVVGLLTCSLSVDKAESSEDLCIQQRQHYITKQLTKRNILKISQIAKWNSSKRLIIYDFSSIIDQHTPEISQARFNQRKQQTAASRIWSRACKLVKTKLNCMTTRLGQYNANTQVIMCNSTHILTSLQTAAAKPVPSHPISTPFGGRLLGT